MRIGIVYPQVEVESDPVAIRDYTQAVEELGFSHILTYSHDLGANPDRPGGWQGPYTYRDPFMEPLVLFSFMAGFTQTIEFTTGILIAPQRQTVLLAKQAATLDILCQGRLRLGIGLGWNQVEYQSLNENFHNRGKRVEEQVELLKLLWTQPLVEFQGRWHSIPDAGILPLPVQRPIPIWFGGHHENVLKRVAALGDGWMPNYATPENAAVSLEHLNKYIDQAGRDQSEIGIEVRLSSSSLGENGWVDWLTNWKSAGATHASFNSMGNGYSRLSQHIKAAERFSSVIHLPEW
jgi:probable F420-dependent oxidoreductase